MKLVSAISNHFNKLSKAFKPVVQGVSNVANLLVGSIAGLVVVTGTKSLFNAISTDSFTEFAQAHPEGMALYAAAAFLMVTAFPNAVRSWRGTESQSRRFLLGAAVMSAATLGVGTL